VSDQDEAPRGYAPGRHRIEDYGGGGFRFGDMSHKGSILALPGGVRAIAATRCQDIDDALIDLALADPNGIDLLIVGTGETLLPAPASLRNRLRAAGSGCESMATGAAVRTYNMLLDEGRRVGALLIAV
jgi:uncharacterized protein